MSSSSVILSFLPSLLLQTENVFPSMHFSLLEAGKVAQYEDWWVRGMLEHSNRFVRQELFHSQRIVHRGVILVQIESVAAPQI
ncbi:hypothetical protein NPIL_517121 [Nephila pilipes]|uniref:Uncharacterized protein n=1 Tax=Nephila pilipes TaxID=299642 RepID=A0A8X6QWQ2_NEPPI|nr:hypothetical protein NPIL_224491 [Nephila pilipes]GFS68578.1 hypothetical protein NPIL_319271 [Nephila pilipes]GFT71020.1 hypothetical protein NPIL_84701 [Nephila pilipes]GFU35620.1 hypothetical protein NPIL_517121 [Nephila pilipes]